MNGKISNLAQIASIRRYTLTEGTGKGLDVLDCDNGALRFLINADKACDVMQMYYKGENLSFISKNGFTKREMPFLTRFEGGMLYTCGLDSAGAREGFEIHGSLHNNPAEILSAKCDESGIEILALLKSTALFGRNLTIKRRVFSAIKGNTLTIDDTLVNDGFADEKYCLLYHINLGYPLLDAGGKIIADVKARKPRNEWAEKNESLSYVIEDCTPKKEETCYYLSLNKPKISYVNEKTGRKFTVKYSGDTLPHFLEWKSMASGDYALGLEPCTTELDNGFNYSVIKPNEEITFKVELTVE